MMSPSRGHTVTSVTTAPSAKNGPKPENSPVLERLADKFVSLGISELAVQCYVKSGDVKKAIDCCVLLNQWN
jgi:hypothetical protein